MKHAAAIVVAAVLVQALLVTLFVLPGHKPEPHGVPVAVAGPPQAAAELEQRSRGAIDAFTTSNPEAAVLDRDAYAAVLPQERTLLIATAASPPVAQLLQGALADVAPTTRELRPLDPEDPRGATLNLMMLPLIVVGLPLAFALARVERHRLAAALSFSVLAGLAVTAIVNLAVGALPGPYLALSAVAALLVASVALFATGLAHVLGPAGIGLAAVLVFLIGNPGSGAASAPELLPGFWRAVGPLLPPGAGASALRNVAYFDGAALATPLIVLGAFAAVGAALLLVPARRSPRPSG
jgi:hypothetical protein